VYSRRCTLVVRDGVLEMGGGVALIGREGDSIWGAEGAPPAGSSPRLGGSECDL